MNTPDPKTALKKLIAGSEAINLLPEKEKADLINRMLSGSPEQIQELLTVFKSEQNNLVSFALQMDALAKELDALTDEMTNLGNSMEKMGRKVNETNTQKEDEKKAEAILKQLDDIV